MNDRLEGVILSSSDYKENDLLLQVFFKDHGVFSLVGKGARKMSAKQHFYPYTKIETIVDLKDGRTMYAARHTTLLKQYGNLSDLSSMAYLAFVSELYLSNREFLDNDDYDILLDLFDKAEEKNIYIPACLALSHFMRKNGIEPYTDGCVHCDNRQVIGLSVSSGGFVCRLHARETDILPVERLKLFRVLSKAMVKHYPLVKDFDVSRNDLSLMCDFYQSNTGTVLRSASFFIAL